jgi:hypothetical protein
MTANVFGLGKGGDFYHKCCCREPNFSVESELARLVIVKYFFPQGKFPKSRLAKCAATRAAKVKFVTRLLHIFLNKTLKINNNLNYHYLEVS